MIYKAETIQNRNRNDKFNTKLLILNLLYYYFNNNSIFI